MEVQDRLTGLMRRTGFDNHFKGSLAHASENDGILTLALIDLDWFKKTNHDYGRKAGDAVLVKVASVLQEHTHSGTCISRFGGEEFALLFPDTEREQAFLAVEQVRSAVEGVKCYPVGSNSIDMDVTISGGVAAYPTDGATVIEVLRKADQALYRAKATGRNKICIAQEERMATKTTHYTLTQLERLSKLSKEEKVGEAVLLREALDDLLIKYRVSHIES